MDVLNQTEQVQLKAPSSPSSHSIKDEAKLDLYANENLIETQEDDEELNTQQQQPSKRKYRSSMSDAEADVDETSHVDHHNDLEPSASSNNHFDEAKHEADGESALINNNNKQNNNNNNDTMLEQDELDVNVNINEDQCLGADDDEDFINHPHNDNNNNNNNNHHQHEEDDDEPPPRPGDEEEGLYDDVMGAPTLNISASDSLLQAPVSTTGANHNSASTTNNNLANTSTGSINTKQLVNNTSGGSGYTKRVSCYIGNLTWWTTDKDLHEVIVNSLQVTDLLEIKFYENKINGQSKGFCLCTVGSDASFRLIMDKLPKHEVNGQMPLCTHFSRHFFNQFEEQARKDMASAAGGGNQANGSQMDHQYHSNSNNNNANSMHHHHNHHAHHHNQGNNFGNQAMSGGGGSGGGGPQGGGPQQQFMSMLFKLMFKNNNFIIIY